MAINKIIYGGETLLDLTADTVTADKVLSPFTFHGKDGVKTSGTCTFDADTSDADLLVAEALENKYYYANGAKKKGTMKNNGAVSGVISTKAGKYSVPIGYHDGSGSVQISSTEQAKIVAGNIKNGVTILGVQGNYTGESSEKPQAKTVTPSAQQQVITPDAASGYTCLSQVTVNAIPYVESANSYGTTVTIG